MCDAAKQAVPQAAPSVQTVYCTLYNSDPQTGKQLREATGLPRRTVYAALEKLRTMGMLHEQLSLRDARQTYFWLEDGPSAAA